VNDYLARRDAVRMGQIYNFLGLTVGVINFGASDLGASGVSTIFDSPFLGMVAVFVLPINMCRCPADVFWHLARRLNLML
jgi:hypothetical protein